MSFLEKLVANKVYRYIRLIQLCLDLLLLNGVYILSIYLRWGNLENIKDSEVEMLSLVLNLTWVLVVIWLHAVKAVRMERISVYIGRIVNAFMLHIILMGLFIFLFKFVGISRLQICYFYAIFAILIILLRIGVLSTLKYLRRKGYNFRTIAFGGWDPYAQQFLDVIKNDPSIGYKIAGYFEKARMQNIKANYLGSVEAISDFLNQNKVDELFITSESFTKEQIQNLVMICDGTMTRLRFIPNIMQFGLSKNIQVLQYGHLPAFTFRKEPLEDLMNRFLKRVFDIVFSSLVILLVFTWLFPIIAILIKLSSKGPVFFKQLRSGENNYQFYCYKFRTMRVNVNSDKLQATKKDPRITKIGAILRKTSLDELPQFINVFLGSMSVVGPRPHMISHTEEYSNHIDDFMVRHYLKPGITGWAQVNGYRGETKEIEDMANRVKCDIWYLENWNFFLDFKIVYLTVYNTINGDPNAF